MYGERFASILTNREIQVLDCIIDGKSNKEVGRALGISPRTVEVHRMRLMTKLNATNAIDLCRIVLMGITPIRSVNSVKVELKSALDAAYVHLNTTRLEVQNIENRIKVFYDLLDQPQA